MTSGDSGPLVTSMLGGSRTPAMISRRSLLGGLSFLAVAAVSGCGFGAPTGDLALDSPWTKKTPFGNPAPQAGPPPRTSSGYTLSADCVLSEDYFLLKLGDYDPDKDQILGYPQNNDYVPEAIMVLNSENRNGTMVQLYHDWTKNSAWATVPVSVNNRELDHVVAGTTVVGRPQRPDNTIGPLHVFYSQKDPANPGAYPPIVHITQQSDSSWQVQPDLGWTQCYAVRQCIGPTGGLFVYGFARNDQQIYWCNVNADGSVAGGVLRLPDSVVSMDPRGVSVCALGGSDDPWTIIYFDVLLDGTMAAWSATVASTGLNQSTDAAPWSGLPAKAQPIDPRSNQPMTLWTVMATFTMDDNQPPLVFVRDLIQRLWCLTSVNSQPKWQLIWTPPSDWDSKVELTAAARALPSASGASSADKALDLYLRAYNADNSDVPMDNSVSVIHQVDTGNGVADSQNPQFTPAVPLLPNIGAFAIPSGRSTNTGFITMDVDGTLQLMTVQPLPADPTTGAPAGKAWVGAPIHTPESDSIQVSSYRAQITLTDDAGLPAVDLPIQVTCPQSVGAMCNGAAVPLGPNPVTLQTNSRGLVTLAIPADGLSCPVLTVTAGGANALMVQPSADINNYCTGTTTLNQLPPLAAGGKITATDTLSADQFASMQTAAKGAIAAPNVKPAAGARRGRQQRVAVVPKKGVKLTAEQQRLGSFLDDWAHDVVQAVKSAATEVKAIENQAATDIAYAVVTISTDLDALAGHALQVVVHDLDDAANVFHAVLNKVKAAVEAAIDFLKAALSGLFSDTADLAKQYSLWITAACGYATTEIGKAKGTLDGWFADQQTAIDGQLDTFSKNQGAAQISKLVPAGPHSTEQQTRPRSVPRAGASAPPPPNPSGAHSNWLLDKIEQVFTPSSIDSIPAVETAFTNLVNELKIVGGDFDAAAGKVHDALTNAISDPKDASTSSLSLFIDALKLLVDGLITLAKGALDLIFDLMVAVIEAVDAILNTPITDLPIVGPLLQKTSLADLTFGQLACLLYAFPATLAYKLANNGKSPVQALSTARAGGRGGKLARPLPTKLGSVEKEAFALLAASTLSTWNAFDLAEAMFAVGGEEPPWWVSIADIVGAAVVGAFTFPATGDADPYTVYPTSSDPGERALFASWASGLALLPAAILTIYVQRSKSDPGTRETYSKGITLLVTGSGVMSAVFGILGDALTKKEAGDYFYTILYSLPAALAPLLLSKGLPPAIVAGVCLVDIFTALYQLLQASLNPS